MRSNTYKVWLGGALWGKKMSQAPLVKCCKSWNLTIHREILLNGCVKALTPVSRHLTVTLKNLLKAFKLMCASLNTLERFELTSCMSL